MSEEKNITDVIPSTVLSDRVECKVETLKDTIRKHQMRSRRFSWNQITDYITNKNIWLFYTLGGLSEVLHPEDSNVILESAKPDLI